MAQTTDELRRFVREALARGVERERIAAALAEAGWPPEQAAAALAAWAETDLPVPVPRPRPSLSAREAFLYLLMFTTLILSAVNLGELVFRIVDHAFPDPAAPRQGAWVLDAVRRNIATLVVAFPIFLVVARHLGRETRRDPAKRLSAVRRWLTYLTLFLAAGVLIADLSTLVYNLLGGELTVRFVLKVLTVGAIAGTIFGHYLHDLRREEREL